MISRRERQHRIVASERLSRSFNLLALVAGMGLVAGAVVVAGRSSDESVWLEVIFQISGTALVSAALVSIVLGSAVMQETVVRAEAAVAQSIEDLLDPVRDVIYADAFRNYRWDCYLSLPPTDDPLPDYAYQTLRISYATDAMPDDVRIICVAARSDDVLRRFADDDRYLFRWLVDDQLDPHDSTICQVGSVRVDGVELEAPKILSPELGEGTAAAEYVWHVPRQAALTGDRLIDLQVTVRKYVGTDRRVRVATTLFRTVTDAEFRLVAATDFHPCRIYTITQDVTRIGPERGDWCGSLFSGPHADVAGVAHFRHALQRGSVVAFLLDRLDSSDTHSEIPASRQ